MKKGFVWFFILCKRQLKKDSFYVVLLIMIIGCVSIKYIADNFTVNISIGFYTEDDGTVANNIKENLLSHNGLITFISYNDRSSLLNDVRSGKIMGGYVLNSELSTHILEGKNDELIDTYFSPNSLILGISNEIFFSFVMKEISYEALVNDTLDTGYFDYLSIDKIRDELRTYYDVNLSNGKTFGVDYNKDDSSFAGADVTNYIYDYISPVIVGLVGLMIFIGGLCGALSYYDDKRHGSLVLLRPASKQLVAIFEIFVPVFLLSFSGYILLYLLDMFDTDAFSLFKYFTYPLIVTGYCFILKGVIRKKSVYIGFIPILVLLSLIFCPVFINLNSILPSLSWLGNFLPLSWLYLIG